MDSRIRSLFFAALALLLGPAALPEPSGQPAGNERHGFEQPPVEHGAHPAASLARTWLADIPSGRTAFAPPASGFALESVPRFAVVAATLVPAARAADATRRLPLSRAPPHLS